MTLIVYSAKKVFILFKALSLYNLDDKMRNKTSNAQVKFTDIITEKEVSYLRAKGLDEERLNRHGTILGRIKISNDPIELEIYAKHQNPEVRMDVAKSLFKSIATQALLRQDPDAAVRHFASMTNKELIEFENENRELERRMRCGDLPLRRSTLDLRTTNRTVYYRNSIEIE